jgi:hypothetical protein
MLQAAPATLPEMSARWLGTTGTRRQQLDKLSRLSITTSSAKSHADPVPRHRQRNVNSFSSVLGDAISRGADAQDRDVKSAAPADRGITGGPAAPDPASPHAAAQSDPLPPSTRLRVS